MEIEKLKEVLECLFKDFYERDSYLIEKNLHENTISHRLAFYLERINEFRDYHIDCEYNCFSSDHKIFISDNKYQAIKISNKDWTDQVYWYLTWFMEWDKYLVMTQNDEIIICKKEVDTYKTSTGEITSSKIRPDIIIHKRWETWDKVNLFVFEIKKNKLNNDDKLKLKWFTSWDFNFKYNYWIWLSNFNSEKKYVQIDIYENGNLKGIYEYQNWNITKIQTT